METSEYPPYIAELNSLRFFAALWVVVFHLNTFVPAPLHREFAISGYLAVDLFFVLSGFIISHVYLGEVRKGTFSVYAFLFHRLSRIYPLHIFVIAMYMLSIVVSKIANVDINQDLPASDLPAIVLLVHGWGILDHISWNVPSWSISAEWFAYLCFSIFAYRVFLVGKYPMAFVVISIFVFIVLCEVVDAAHWQPITSRTWNFSILRILPEFALGCSIYAVGRGVRIGYLWTLALLFTLVAAVGVAISIDTKAQYIVLMEAAIVFLAANLSKYDRGTFLRNGVLSYLGRISYSTYMIHTFTILVMFKLISQGGHDRGELSVWIWIPAIIGVLGVSAVLYHAVEMPCRRMLRRAYDGTVRRLETYTGGGTT